MVGLSVVGEERLRKEGGLSSISGWSMGKGLIETRPFTSFVICIQGIVPWTTTRSGRG